MKLKKSYSLKVLFPLLVCIPLITIGQNSDKKTITYKSPSKNFIDITIQSHKGLPRFGDLYYHRGVTPSTNRIAYNELLKMRYLTTIYTEIDKSKLTNYDNNQENLKDFHSVSAQNHLLQLAGLVGSDALLEKYFCDKSTAVKCIYIDKYGQRKRNNYWGGSRNNRFQQMRSYKNFINDDYLETLQNWSNTVFKGNEITAYFVGQSMVVGKYDFKQKGYWVWGMGSGSFIIQPSQFNAYSGNERNLKNRKMFLSIPPAKAKGLNLQNRAPVFTVFKVKVIPKENHATHVEFSFELDNKIIEIYKDKALTNKIGEINIDTTVFKY